MKFFSNKELRDLAIAILLLSFILSFPDLNLFFLAILIVFFSYFLHEMGHKMIARKLGCMTNFKLWPAGIFVGIFSAFFKLISGIDIVFVAPGFVEIMPYRFGRWGFKVVTLGTKDLGLISLGGVGINILLMIIFKAIPGQVFELLSYYNGLIALFNLLPIPPLDGSKIFLWKEWFWLFLIFITVLALVL